MTIKSHPPPSFWFPLLHTRADVLRNDQYSVLSLLILIKNLLTLLSTFLLSPQSIHSEEHFDMEAQNYEKDVQFSPLAINWIGNDALGYVHDANHHYVNEIHQVPFPMTRWMHRQQTPQNYVDFLAGSDQTEILNGMFCNNSAQVSSLGLADPYQVEEYRRLYEERNLISQFTNMEQQLCVQKQDCSDDFQAYTSTGATVSKSPPESHRKRSREKAYAADRNRRFKISLWLDALQDLLPHFKEGSKEALLDDVIDHVKNLQHQVKELCRSRLGGEPASNSFIFLEGHGHYLLHEQMLSNPLEDTMGELLEVNPSAATELLQSRGLIVMPMTFEEGLHEPIEMLDMQGMRLDRILEDEFPANSLTLI